MFNFFIKFADAQTTGFPTIGGDQTIPGLIVSIYEFAFAIIGLIIFVQIIYAGFLYITAAGNSGNIGVAKSKITNAIIGAILLLSSWLILNVINPDLVENTFKFGVPGGESRTPTKEASPGEDILNRLLRGPRK